MNSVWSKQKVIVDEAAAATILYVEDEAFVREVTLEILQSAGYRVLSARNAAEAERLYEERGPEINLLLTDVILPGESGRVLASRMRRENPWLRVLYVTGYAEQMMAAEEAGVACLAKPFSGEALLQRVRDLIESGESQTDGEEWVMPACVGA
jgi:two-component system cell cycle sensor histidine kinase/response regulator CckA